METSTFKKGSQFQHSIGMTDLGKGLYILKLDLDGNTIQRKVILE